MIDIVDVFLADIDLDQELHRLDDILLGQGEVVEGFGVVEFLVELVPADLSEVVAPRREEHRGEVLVGRLEGDRLPGHDDRVDGGEGLFAARLVMGRIVTAELDLLAVEAVEYHGGIERALRLEIDDVELDDAGMQELVHVVRMDLLPRLVDLLALAVLGHEDRLRKDPSDELVLDLAILADRHFHRRVEAGDDVLAGLETEGPEKKRAKYPFLAVDLGVDQFLLLVDLELEPGPAVRDEARGVDPLLVGEDDARRPVDLGNDDALGAVDDEGSAVRHERKVAHVDVFLANFTCLLEYEVDLRLQGHGVGKPLLFAFEFREFDVVFVEDIARILEQHVSVRAFDGEGRLKDLFKPLPIYRLSVLQFDPLQKTLVRHQLYVDQVGQVHDVLKILADIGTLYQLTIIEHQPPPPSTVVNDTYRKSLLFAFS